MSQPKNPWHELPDEPPWLLPADEAATKRWAAHMHLELMPEPFIGAAESATVVLLMKAPGVDANDERFHRMPQVQQVIRRSYEAGQGCFHPFEPEMAGSPAEAYWRGRLRPLIDVAGEENVRRRLFVAQAFPYHAEGSAPVDQVRPPSFDFTKSLVIRAAARGALLVVVNGTAGWREALGPELFESAHRVKNPRAGRVSRGNLEAFDEVLEALVQSEVSAPVFQPAPHHAPTRLVVEEPRSRRGLFAWLRLEWERWRSRRR